MKPGDHPEFFRFPAPEGRSRESSIRLDAEGRFWHDGEPVLHPGMARAFASWIGRHPDDGRYILNNGYDWTYFSVEGTPYFVESVELVDPETAVLVLSDGTREPFVPAALSLGPGGALVLPVKSGGFEARFSRAAQLSLSPWLVEGPDGSIWLKLGGRSWPLPQSPPEA